MPETAFNRLADNWRPLFAIAEIAGGDWPQRARAAFIGLTATADLDAQGVGTMLLVDIAAIFAAKDRDKLPSLEESLAAIEAGEAADKLPSARWLQGWPKSKGDRGQNGESIGNRFPQTNSPTNCAALVSRRVGFELATKRLAVICSTISKRHSRDICLIPPLPDCNTATMLGETPISEVQQAESVLHPEKAASTEGMLQCCTPERGGKGK